MKINCGGVLKLSYSDSNKVNKKQVAAAFGHINWTPDGVESILKSISDSDEDYTGLTFTGTTVDLEKFLFAVDGTGVEIEVLKEPPTPELAKHLEDAWSRYKTLGRQLGQ